MTNQEKYKQLIQTMSGKPTADNPQRYKLVYKWHDGAGTPLAVDVPTTSILALFGDLDLLDAFDAAVAAENVKALKLKRILEITASIKSAQWVAFVVELPTGLDNYKPIMTALASKARTRLEAAGIRQKPAGAPAIIAEAFDWVNDLPSEEETP